MQTQKDIVGIIAGAVIIVTTLMTAQALANKVTTGIAMTVGVGLVYFSAKPKSN